MQDTIEQLGGEKMAALAINLRRLRTEKQMTQEDVARKADLPLGTVERIESARTKNPRIDTVEKLARDLGEEMVELLRNPEVNGSM